MNACEFPHPGPAGATARGRALRLLALSFITGFSGAMMPGPLLVAVIGQTTVQGFRAVLGLITGHAILELLVLGLLIAGLRAVLDRPRVRGGIGLVGGVVLLWMAWDMIGSARTITLSLNAEAAPAYSWPKLLVWGAAVCAANPYFIGWWATIGAGQLSHMAPRTPVEYAAFYVGHEASDYLWYAIVGAILVTGRAWLTDGAYRGMILGCGIVIAALGGWFVFRGLRILRNGRAVPGRASA